MEKKRDLRSENLFIHRDRLVRHGRAQNNIYARKQVGKHLITGYGLMGRKKSFIAMLEIFVNKINDFSFIYCCKCIC